MNTEIIVSIITGVLTLLGVCVTSWATSRKSSAVTDYKIEELTREVREHNNFAQRIPVLEEQMKIANHRINDLEKITKGGKA